MNFFLPSYFLLYRNKKSRDCRQSPAGITCVQYGILLKYSVPYRELVAQEALLTIKYQEIRDGRKSSAGITYGSIWYSQSTMCTYLELLAQEVLVTIQEQEMK